MATERSIHPRVLQWEKPQVDLFATRPNCNLLSTSLQFQMRQHWRSTHCHFLSILWDNLTMYTFSPTTILTKVLQKLQRHAYGMILLAPLWPKQRWFLNLLEMLVHYLLELPQWSRLLKQPQSDIYHLNPEAYKLVTWRLSNQHTEIVGFQQRLQKECQKHKKSQVYKYMKGNGNS